MCRSHGNVILAIVDLQLDKTPNRVGSAAQVDDNDDRADRHSNGAGARTARSVGGSSESGLNVLLQLKQGGDDGNGGGGKGEGGVSDGDDGDSDRDGHGDDSTKHWQSRQRRAVLKALQSTEPEIWSGLEYLH